MCEDVARTIHIAQAAGPVEPIDKTAVDRLYDRYQNVYGQP
jgi:L-ribulose-5-phosphate 4-epimerase